MVDCVRRNEAVHSDVSWAPIKGLTTVFDMHLRKVDDNIIPLREKLRQAKRSIPPFIKLVSTYKDRL